MGARWEAAYDAQVDVYKSVTGLRGRQYLDGYQQSIFREHPNLDQPGSLYRNIADRLADMTFNADPIYIDPDMMTVFEAAWPQFKPEPFAPTDLVTPYGFALLPRPIKMLDKHGKTVTARAVLWAPATLRKKVPRDPSDDEPAEAGVVVALFHGTGDTDDWTTQGEVDLGPFDLMHFIAIAFGEDLSHNPEMDGPDNDHDPTEIIRPVQCLWRLMSQSLVVSTPERPSKPFRKRWEAMRLPNDKKVTVVRLRRTYEDKTPDGEVHTVEWKSRWLVRGHWRNVWHSSIQMHRQQWVAAFIKGPADKPLIIKKMTAFELVR